MTLRFYNTLSNKVEDFEPREPGKVRMYNCGPTVYNDQHIGNHRSYLFADTLRRHLEYRGYEVTQVMNITDVGHLTEDDMRESGEDKILKTAREKGWDPYKVAEHYMNAFFEDRKTLGYLEPHQVPRATDHIPEMIEMIQALLGKGIAYQVGGNIYYDVSKFPEYGKLSGNTIDKIRSGARIEPHPDKKHPADFALWKTDEKHLMQFDSPWGKGFPGWHIECSAMSRKYLGDSFDIHTGGQDNVFPHHECEIAQSEMYTGKPFVKYWVHPQWLMFDSGKISKSKGTILNVAYFTGQGYDPMAIRYALVSAHHRQQVSFSIKMLEDATKALERLREFKRRLLTVGEGSGEVDGILEKAKGEFVDAMDNDLNVAGALSVLHDLARDVNRLIDESGLGADEARKVLETLDGFDHVFGVLGNVSTDEKAPREVENLVQERQRVRAAKDFARSDELRDAIRKLGWIVEDSKGGPKLKRVR